MVSRGELFESCMSDMERSGVDSPRFDTLCIFEDMTGVKMPLAEPQREVPDDVRKRIESLVKRRCEGYPLQYLLGEWEFFGLPFKVGEGVLIPRPDTETLVEQILDICAEMGMKSPKIADLCSGTGCIAIALKKQIPDSEVYAVELSEKALQYLKMNAELNNADITIIYGDALDDGLCSELPQLDIIVSNPPYLTAEEMTELMTEVRHEPQSALFGGEDGLDFYRAITAVWKHSLRIGGILAYEFGMGQHEAVGNILKDNSFTNIKFRKDAGGIIRTAAAVRQEEK